MPVGAQNPDRGPGFIMERIERIGLSNEKVTPHVDIVQVVYDKLDRFMEKKVYKFLIVAVPVYLGAHLVVYMLNMATGGY